MTRRESLIAMLGAVMGVKASSGLLIFGPQLGSGGQPLLWAGSENGRCIFGLGNKRITRDEYIAETKRRADAFFAANGMAPGTGFARLAKAHKALAR